MAENKDNDDADDKYRVVTTITEKERLQLKYLAKRDGRSMSAYLRSLLLQEIEAKWG